MFFYVLLSSSCLPGVSLQACKQTWNMFVNSVLSNKFSNVVLTLSASPPKPTSIVRKKAKLMCLFINPLKESKINLRLIRDMKHHETTCEHHIIYLSPILFGLNMCELQKGPCWSIIYSRLFAAFVDSLHSRNITQRLASLNIRILSCNYLYIMSISSLYCIRLYLFRSKKRVRKEHWNSSFQRSEERLCTKSIATSHPQRGQKRCSDSTSRLEVPEVFDPTCSIWSSSASRGLALLASASSSCACRLPPCA